MINQVILVGRIARKPILHTDNNNKKICNLTLAVNRSFKNESGIYETDFIKIILTSVVAERVVDCCNIGDIIGIKGKLEVQNNALKVIAEKVTFLATNNTGKEIINNEE